MIDWPKCINTWIFLSSGQISVLAGIPSTRRTRVATAMIPFYWNRKTYLKSLARPRTCYTQAVDRSALYLSIPRHDNHYPASLYGCTTLPLLLFLISNYSSWPHGIIAEAISAMTNTAFPAWPWDSGFRAIIFIHFLFFTCLCHYLPPFAPILGNPCSIIPLWMF